MDEPQPSGAAPTATPQPAPSGYWGAPPPARPAFGAPAPASTQPVPGQHAPQLQTPPGFRWQPADLVAGPPAYQQPRPPVAQPSTPVGSLVVITIGLVLLILSMTTMTWFGSGLISNDFGSLHEASDIFSGPWFFDAYFSWLAITLVVVSLVAAYATKLFRPPPIALALAALFVSLGGAVATFCAPLNGNSFHDVMKAASGGYWCMIVGFVLVGLGALLRA